MHGHMNVKKPHVMLLILRYIKKELTFISYPTFQIASSKVMHQKRKRCAIAISLYINPYPTAFPYGNGMVLHFYQQQESSTTKTVHKVINRGLEAYV